jgi:hypothetical protein
MEKTVIKGKIVTIGTIRESQNGSSYCDISLVRENRELGTAETFKGIFFFKGEIPLKINQEFELSSWVHSNGTNMFNLHELKKSFQKSFNKDYEAMKMAIQLVCNGKVPLEKIKDCRDFLKKHF